MKAALILGNQLHRKHPALMDKSIDIFIMVEAQDICKKFIYHKHKLILILSAMRHYADFLRKQNKTVIYKNIDNSECFIESLKNIFIDNNIAHLAVMRPTDLSTAKKISRFFDQHNIVYEFYESQNFITPLDELGKWFSENPKGIMEQFYRWQRKRMSILLDNGKPVGGAWNYDKENRKPLPKNYEPIPEIPKPIHDHITRDVITTVDKLFPDNPGDSNKFWLPVTHDESDVWLEDFIDNRLNKFGTYEDALHHKEQFLYHSVLSPLINAGLLEPYTCVDRALLAFYQNKVPLHSIEGFVRQIIGWREYMYGTYLRMSDYEKQNYFGFTKELEQWWYKSDSPKHDTIPLPVRIALKNVHEHGYNHHIERLMVLGNWFLLNQYNPMSVFNWFSAMYVDAYEWVMVPNVIGMSQYADGGRVATKPYISGGNYLKKMGIWGDISQKDLETFTTLYWQLLRDHKDKLQSNPRMKLMLSRA